MTKNCTGRNVLQASISHYGLKIADLLTLSSECDYLQVPLCETHILYYSNVSVLEKVLDI